MIIKGGRKLRYMGNRKSKKRRGKKIHSRVNHSTNGNAVKTINGNNTTLAQEQMIEIHAEAYYRAFKRLEEEKTDTSTPTKEEDRWYTKLLIILNVMFFPWRINKKFSVRKRIYDSVLVISVSAILKFSGLLMWLAGILSLGKVIIELIAFKRLSLNMATIAISFLMVVMGSLFTLAGKEFEKEDDSNKIYAYSASVIALVSCVVGIIAVFK